MKSKKKALTPEEKLAQALLPREEWPYELPKGWVWTRLGVLSASQYGYTAKALQNADSPKFLRITDIQDGNINWGTVPNCNIDGKSLDVYKLTPGDIVIARTGATTGKSCFLLNLPQDTVFASFLIRLRIKRQICKYFIYLFLQSDLYWKQITELSAGIAQPGVNSSKLKGIKFPLPPLTEQQRIVDKIESLFAKLDEAGDRLQKVLDGYEARRAAILHEAFSGKWTGDSGEQSDIKRMPLKKCGVWHGGGTPSKSHPEYWANGSIMWITSKDMKTDVIENSLICVNEKGIENSSAVYSDKPAVLFVMRSGVLRHTLPIAMVSKPYTVNQDLKALTPEEGILPEYVMWACKAEEKTILNQCMKSGTTVESINFQSLLHFQIPIYPEKKQRYIVDRIHKALTSEESSLNHISSVYTQIDIMKKSILARAFRGELGTQNPSDPSALELLKECVLAGKEISKS